MGFELWNNLMVDLFVVRLKQPASVVIHFQRPTSLAIPFCGASHYTTSRIVLRYLIVIPLDNPRPPLSSHQNLSCLLNRTEFSLFRYGNAPSNPLLTTTWRNYRTIALYSRELGQSHTKVVSVLSNWFIKPEKLLRGILESMSRCLGEKTQVREGCGHFSAKNNQNKC